MAITNPGYRGRFAPSPTGPLHMGSLFAAVISYLHARAQQGQWLVRIEDLDPPREQPEAKEQILRTLAKHGFKWDEPIVYQSERADIYEACLAKLAHLQSTYFCPCSRKQLSENNGKHSDACLKQEVAGLTCAVKFKGEGQEFAWQDAFQGAMSLSVHEDFVLKRKDNLYAYQLAVVCDDLEQKITHVIRGADLIDSTPMQLALYEALSKTAPEFAHFPVIVASNQQKLSKQNLAPAVNDDSAVENLCKIFAYLDIALPGKPASPEQALEMAVNAWRETLPAKLNLASIVE